MTKGEARALFLAYLGEASVNGLMKNDPDLRLVFDRLIGPAVTAVGLLLPHWEVVCARDEWQMPADGIEVTQIMACDGSPAEWRRLGDKYIFHGVCIVEYTRRPAKVDERADDSVVLDLDEAKAQLVPIKAAVDAAASLDSCAYKVPYLTAAYNALLSSLDSREPPRRRRVFAV